MKETIIKKEEIELLLKGLKKYSDYLKGGFDVLGGLIDSVLVKKYSLVDLYEMIQVMPEELLVSIRSKK